MANKQITMRVKSDLLDRIDDYWYKRRFMNRSQAIKEILQIALETEEVKKTITEFKKSNK